MIWKNFFLAGLILALAPFNIKIDQYEFRYSLLGYGLILLSYLYKRKWKNELFIIISLSLIIILGTMNLFSWTFFFQIFFFLGVAIIYFSDSGKKIVSTISWIMIGLIGFMLALQIGTSLNINLLQSQPYITNLVLNSSYYFCFAMTFTMLALDYKKL